MDLVLLDRDGVLNVDHPESIKSVEALKLLPNAAKAVALLNAARIPVVVITNQAAVGRGALTLETLTQIHQRLEALLAEEGAQVDKIIVCTDTEIHPNYRRKPAPGMLHEALALFKADPQKTPMIGDDLRDLEAATAAGCPRILVRTGKGKRIEAAGIPTSVQPVAIFDDLLEAVLSLLESVDKTM